MKKCMIIAVALMAVVLAGNVRADTVLIGEPFNNQDCIPFGCGIVTQQIFDNDEFPAMPISLTAITYFNSVFDPPDTFDPATYTFKLSTAATDHTAPSATFADNVGPDETVVLVTALPSAPYPASFTFVFSTPFTYDPSAGDLLLEIDKPDGTHSFSGFTDNNAGFAGFSRIWNGDGGPVGAVDLSYGQVVEFTFEPVVVIPEPATLTLAGLGILSAVGWGCRRRKAK
jgi:hypothetical protein